LAVYHHKAEPAVRALNHLDGVATLAGGILGNLGYRNLNFHAIS
jgi:hypothetical protein